MPYQLSNDFINKWEHIVDDVDKTSVPTECINRVKFRLKHNKQKTINYKTLRNKGLSTTEIEEVVNDHIEEFGDSIISVELFVDIEAIADIVQPETDKLLTDIE